MKPVIEKLESLFSKFNEKFYNGELQTPIIKVSPDTAKVVETLLHEMVHLYNLQMGVQDTSRGGTYHDRAQKGFVLRGRQSPLMTNSEILAVSKILLESRALSKWEMSQVLDKLISGCVPLENMKLVSNLVASEKKTAIWTIKQGFDFLSRHYRYYNGHLNSQPSEGSVIRIEQELQTLIINFNGTQRTLIEKINQKTHGWAYYHRQADPLGHQPVCSRGLCPPHQESPGYPQKANGIYRAVWNQQEGCCAFCGKENLERTFRYVKEHYGI